MVRSVSSEPVQRKLQSDGCSGHERFTSNHSSMQLVVQTRGGNSETCIYSIKEGVVKVLNLMTTKYFSAIQETILFIVTDTITYVKLTITIENRLKSKAKAKVLKNSLLFQCYIEQQNLNISRLINDSDK